MSTSTDAINADLKNKLLEYKVGDKNGLGSFSDADPGEMNNFAIRIGVFGHTGSGKSTLINTISKILGSEVDEVTISQSAGGEGTRVLEECTFGGFSMFDTRGFFDINAQLEETEFFRVLYGSLRPGEEIDRGDMGRRKTESAGIAAHKLNKPPLKRQLHVALWVIKGTDIKLINDDYQDRLDFILSRLGKEAITIITVVTHEDVIQKMPNADKVRKETLKKAREVTKSLPCNTFLVQNWIENVGEFCEGSTKQILTMIHTALECGERSVKIRQTKRRQQELEAERNSNRHVPTESEDTNVNKLKQKFNNL